MSQASGEIREPNLQDVECTSKVWAGRLVDALQLLHEQLENELKGM